jgi:hypothetical protein
MEYICCSNVAICADVCSRVCSCCFFRLRAALAAIAESQLVVFTSCIFKKPEGYENQIGRDVVKTPKTPRHVPFLFVLTFFLAIASCSSIWFCKCRSRFCSISSCDLNPRMAFLGLSFRDWALCPPNQPHTPDMLYYVLLARWIRYRRTSQP